MGFHNLSPQWSKQQSAWCLTRLLVKHRLWNRMSALIIIAYLSLFSLFALIEMGLFGSLIGSNKKSSLKIYFLLPHNIA